MSTAINKHSFWTAFCCCSRTEIKYSERSHVTGQAIFFCLPKKKKFDGAFSSRLESTRPITMSRFFRSADSESETDSSDNESYISDEELDSSAEESSEDEQQQEAQPSRSRFLKGAGTDSEDESDDELGRARQVKSQKDKRLEAMQNSIKAIENGQKNSDWGLISAGTPDDWKLYFTAF